MKYYCWVILLSKSLRPQNLQATHLNSIQGSLLYGVKIEMKALHDCFKEINSPKSFCVITKLVIIANIVFHCSTRACESRFLLYVNNK